MIPRVVVVIPYFLILLTFLNVKANVETIEENKIAKALELLCKNLDGCFSNICEEHNRRGKFAENMAPTTREDMEQLGETSNQRVTTPITGLSGNMAPTAREDMEQVGETFNQRITTPVAAQTLRGPVASNSGVLVFTASSCFHVDRTMRIHKVHISGLYLKLPLFRFCHDNGNIYASRKRGMLRLSVGVIRNWRIHFRGFRNLKGIKSQVDEMDIDRQYLVVLVSRHLSMFHLGKKTTRVLNGAISIKMFMDKRNRILYYQDPESEVFTVHYANGMDFSKYMVMKDMISMFLERQGIYWYSCTEGKYIEHSNQGETKKLPVHLNQCDQRNIVFKCGDTVIVYYHRNRILKAFKGKTSHSVMRKRLVPNELLCLQIL